MTLLRVESRYLGAVEFMSRDLNESRVVSSVDCGEVVTVDHVSNDRENRHLNADF